MLTRATIDRLAERVDGLADRLGPVLFDALRRPKGTTGRASVSSSCTARPGLGTPSADNDANVDRRAMRSDHAELLAIAAGADDEDDSVPMTDTRQY